MTICYLALGSNLRSPERQLHKALRAIKKLPRSSISKISSMYKSTPCLGKGQPQYINMVIALNTHLTSLQLLNYCQLIELNQERVRKVKNQARTIDIDILLFGSLVRKNIKLEIPHPRMFERDFVLIPLLEIAPNLKTPNGRFIKDQSMQCSKYIISDLSSTKI